MNLGFKLLDSDSSIYSTLDGLDGIVIITYMDDFLLIGPDITKITVLKKKLSIVFSMKDLRLYYTFLGIKLVYN